MSKILQVFKNKETRGKILFTILIVFLYRVGTVIPLPGIPFEEMANNVQNASSNSALVVLNLFSGGAMDHIGILALGIMPYITASIIMQLMGEVIPRVREWQKGSIDGQRNMIRWTRYLTIIIGLIEAIGYDMMFQSSQYGIRFNADVPFILSNLLVIFGLLIGVIVLMWMAELITQHGIGGNGMSIIIFTNVVSALPQAIASSVTTTGGAQGIALTVAYIALIVIILPLIVYVERSQRRLPVRSTKEGSRTRYARQSNTNYVPVNWDIAGMFALIYASCMLQIPSAFAAIFNNVEWMTTFANAVTIGPINWIVNFLLVFGFCYFQAPINLKPDMIADNLKKTGAFIPGVRPGRNTSEYITYVMNHLTLFGATFIGALAVASSMLFFYTNSVLLQAFGGTAILIMVSVAMQFMSQIDQTVRATDPDEVLRRLGK